MNKLWDDLKDNMKEWGVSAVEKAEEISRVAVAKGEEFTKISKLKFEILQLQKDKNKIYERLGLLVYNKTNESNVSNFTGDVEYFSLIERINKYSIEISEKDEVKDTDDAESDIEVLDDSAEDTIPEIEDDNFSDESENSDSNIDELEEFEIDEEIDDDLDDDEFLDNNDDNSVEDVISSVKKNKEED